MKPTIGRIVHYQSVEGRVRPAMIVEVFETEQVVNLFVYEPLATPHGSYFTGAEELTEGERQAGVPGWYWPPRKEVSIEETTEVSFIDNLELTDE